MSFGSAQRAGRFAGMGPRTRRIAAERLLQATTCSAQRYPRRRSSRPAPRGEARCVGVRKPRRCVIPQRSLPPSRPIPPIVRRNNATCNRKKRQEKNGHWLPRTRYGPSALKAPFSAAGSGTRRGPPLANPDASILREQRRAGRCPMPMAEARRRARGAVRPQAAASGAVLLRLQRGRLGKVGRPFRLRERPRILTRNTHGFVPRARCRRPP